MEVTHANIEQPQREAVDPSAPPSALCALLLLQCHKPRFELL